MMKNKSVKLLCLAIGLTVWSSSDAVEAGPLLISEVPAGQVYTEAHIEQIKKHDVSVLKANSGDALVDEYLFYKKVFDLDASSLSEEQRRFLEQSSQHKTKVYKRHPEGPIAVPIFDIPSLAKHKLFLNDAFIKKQELVNLLSTNAIQFAQSSFSTPAHTEAAKLVLHESEGSLSPVTIDVLVKNYQHSANPSSLTLLKALMESSQSYSAAAALLSSEYDSPLKHQALGQLGQYFSSAEHEKLLREEALNQPKLASQALIEYGKLPSSVLRMELLYSKLADDKLGASSALALSRVLKQSSDYSAVVDNLKQQGASRHLVANSLLTLKLANTADSRAVLQTILDNDDIQFDDMKAEVTTWLN